MHTITSAIIIGVALLLAVVVAAGTSIIIRYLWYMASACKYYYESKCTHYIVSMVNAKNLNSPTNKFNVTWYVHNRSIPAIAQ